MSINTRVSELLVRAPHPGPFTPLGAVMSNRVDGLYYTLKSAATIETIDYSERIGMDIYRRTASAILYAALADVAPNARAVVGQSISDCYFFEIHGHQVDAELIGLLESRMREIVATDLPMEPAWTTVEEALEIFEKRGDTSVVKMLKQLRRSEMPMITLGQYRGYGARAGRVSHRPHRRLQDPPLRARHPARGSPTSAGGWRIDRPAAEALRHDLETKRWNKLIHTENVAELNESCMGGAVADFVKVAEAL